MHRLMSNTKGMNNEPSEKLRVDQGSQRTDHARMVAGGDRVLGGTCSRLHMGLHGPEWRLLMDEIERDIDVLSGGFLAAVCIMCAVVTVFLWGGAW